MAGNIPHPFDGTADNPLEDPPSDGESTVVVWEEDDDDYEDEDEDEDDEDEETQIVIPPPLNPSPPPRVSEGTSSSMAGDGEFNREDIEGLYCPICIEPWSNDGDHQPSCLACGHLFGMSCIKKWLGQRRNSGKCPQCNKKCTLKDVRRIYGSRVVVVDEESQKRIRFLEAKCESLEKKDEVWQKKEDEWLRQVSVWQKKEVEVCWQLQQLTERTNNLEHALGDVQNKSMSLSATSGFEARSATGHKVGITCSPESSYAFALQQEVLLDGARCFDVDDLNQVLLVTRSPVRIGGSYILTKMSLSSPQEQDNIPLPSSVKAVRDLRISPFSSLALLASMGKKLTVVSVESNNIVLNYDLPAAAWSCSWDINSSYYAYAGLQNGMLLVFDMRQTLRPLESRNGLTSNPIHTIYSLSDDSTGQTEVKKLLTASSVGMCQWDVDVAQEQPVFVTEAMNQGICISLAYSPCNDNIVATFRPRLEMSDDISVSQPSQTHISNMGQHVVGSHVLFKRTDSSFHKLGSTSAYVPGVRLPKSTILNMGNDNSVYACGDEATSNLVLQKLPLLTITQNLQSHNPIRDVKYSASQKAGLLCCLSGNRMQFFHRQIL